MSDTPRRPPTPPIKSPRDLYEFDRQCIPIDKNGNKRKPWHLLTPAQRLAWEETVRL